MSRTFLRVYFGDRAQLEILQFRYLTCVYMRVRVRVCMCVLPVWPVWPVYLYACVPIFLCLCVRMWVRACLCVGHTFLQKKQEEMEKNTTQHDSKTNSTKFKARNTTSIEEVTIPEGGTGARGSRLKKGEKRKSDKKDIVEDMDTDDASESKKQTKLKRVHRMKDALGDGHEEHVLERQTKERSTKKKRGKKGEGVVEGEASVSQQKEGKSKKMPRESVPSQKKGGTSKKMKRESMPRDDDDIVEVSD